MNATYSSYSSSKSIPSRCRPRWLPRFLDRLRPVAWIFAGFAAFAPAMRAAPAPVLAHGLVTLRFLFLDDTGGAYSLKRAKDFVELGDIPYYVGAPVTVSAGDRLELFRETPTPASKDGKSQRVKVATIAPPADMTGALVVVTPLAVVDPKSGVACNLMYFDNSPEAFPAKSIRVVNLGQMPVAARFSASQVLAAPGAAQIVQPEIDARNRVRTKAAVQTASGWQLLYDSLTIVRPKQRVTALCVFSPSGMKEAYDADELAQIGNPPPGHFWITYSEVL